MRERRLLERISCWSQEEGRSHQTHVEVLVRSVSDHLRRLLNTRQGSVPLDPQFGVPDFTNLAGALSGGSFSEIESEICRMVSRYEPRLKSPKVTVNPQNSDVLAIQFSLEGQLEVDQKAIPLRLETVIGASGRVDIQNRMSGMNV